MAGCGGSRRAERIQPGRGRRAPSRFISTPHPWFITLSFNPFSPEIKVSSCLCTSFRFLAPLANYSICLPQNYLSGSQLHPPCPRWQRVSGACSPCRGRTAHTPLRVTFPCGKGCHRFSGFQSDSGMPWLGAGLTLTACLQTHLKRYYCPSGVSSQEQHLGSQIC